jgi:hypothetical protein
LGNESVTKIGEKNDSVSLSQNHGRVKQRTVTPRLWNLPERGASGPISPQKEDVNPVFNNTSKQLESLLFKGESPSNTLKACLASRSEKLAEVGLIALHKLLEKGNPLSEEDRKLAEDFIEKKLLPKGFDLDLSSLRLIGCAVRNTNNEEFLKKIGDVLLAKSPGENDLLKEEKLALKHLIEGYEYLNGNPPDEGSAKKCFLESIKCNPTQEAALGLIKAGEKDKGKKFLKLTCMRDGGLDSASPTVRRYQMVFNYLKSENEADLQGNFEGAFGYLSQKDGEVQAGLLCEDLKFVTNSLPSKLEFKAKDEPSGFPNVGAKLYDTLKQKTYSLRGATHCVAGGNVAFGANIAALAVCERDRALASKILKAPIKNLFETIPEGFNAEDTIAGQKNPEKGMALMDAFIREMYRTSELEDLKSDFHTEFDEEIKNNKNAGGLNKKDRDNFVVEGEGRSIPNSQTNVCTNLASRIGDCRHHAQIKALLYDQNQRDLCNEKIKAMASMPGVDTTEDELKTVLQKDMRIFDMTIIADVETSGMYEIQKNPANGLPLVALTEKENPRILEEHTMTVLIDQTTREVTMADSFYHDAYKLNKGSIGEHNAEAKEVACLKWKKDKGETWEDPETIPCFDSNIKVIAWNKETQKEEELHCKISTVGYSRPQLQRTKEMPIASDQGKYFGVEQDFAEEKAILLDSKSAERSKQFNPKNKQEK